MNRNNKDPVTEVLTTLFRLIASFFKALFRGIVRLRTRPAWAILAITVIISVLAAHYRTGILNLDHLFGRSMPLFVRYIFLLVLAAAPIWYLLILGAISGKNAGKYDEIFEDIAFMDKKKKYPVFVRIKKDGHKNIYYFYSKIPLSEWKKAKDRLETGFDCSIRRVNYDKDKRTVRLVTVSSDFQIPEKLLWNDTYLTPNDTVLHIGASDIDNVSFDLDRTPHVLAAGQTGSGKSVALRCMLWQMINKGCRLYMIDFKGGVEFGKQYERFGEVITDRKRALTVLEMLVEENTVRLAIFRELEIKKLKEYNAKTHSNLCRIGVFCDELAEMLDKKGVAKSEREIYEKLEAALSTLARLGRAAGINLFLGVQRPDANVLTGQIKNNVPVRISGQFPDKPASEIVLGNTAACDLPEIPGRLLFKTGNETIEFQAYFFDDERDLHEIDINPGEMLTDMPSAKSVPAVESASVSVSQDFLEEKRALSPKVESEIDFDFDF